MVGDFALYSFWLAVCVLLSALVHFDGLHAQEGPLNTPENTPLDLRPMLAPALQGQSPTKTKPQPKKEPEKIAPSTNAPVALRSSESTGSTKQSILIEKPQEKGVAPIVEAKPPFDELVISKYCANLSVAASDGRLSWQARRFEEIEVRLKERIAELEKKRAETEVWLKRREESLRKADESVVAIYSKMKPDAAAAQFSAMDESGAAAILMKLNPRMASTVLNEIDASRAARIAAEMAGVAPPRDLGRVIP